MIVVAIIGLLAAIAIPNFIRARVKSQQNGCVNNLRQYDGAVQQWALEYKKSAGEAYTLADLKPYMKLTSAGELPACPAAGVYTEAATVDAGGPTCSLKVSDGHVLP